MKQALRTALFAIAALTTLAFASSAFASFAPKLVVSSTDVGGPTRIGVVISNTDDPTAQALIYVPNGYAIAAPAPGTKLGDVTATVSAADLNGQILPLTGELDAISAAQLTPAGQQAVAACSQSGTPTQIWDLHMSVNGQTIDIPVSVIPATATEMAAGYQAKLCVFLPPPDVPSTNPARAVFGAKLLSATFTTSAISEPSTTGNYRWTSLWTPYTPGAGTPNAAGSVETQSIRDLPVILHFFTSKKRVVTYKHVTKKKRIKVISTVVKWKSNVTDGATAAPKSSVVVLYKGKKIGGATGSLTLKGVKSAKLTIVAAIDSDTGTVATGVPASLNDLFYHDSGASSCTASPIFGGLPCIDSTVGGEFLAGTDTVTAYTK